MKTDAEYLDLLFDSCCVKENGCWNWFKGVAGRGYGVLSYRNKQVYAHRLMYQLLHPDEVLIEILHSCDNPRCINPNHLSNGTRQDNTDDRVAKKRGTFGEKIPQSKLTAQDIRDIRSNNDLNLYQLAAKYNVTPSNIYYIKARHSWRHIE